ncbi:NACHT, LRR and PYD domains-containing protein 12-like isoform X3, partial [Clarias magur]
VETERPHPPSRSPVPVDSDRLIELNQDDEETLLRLHPSASVPVMTTPQELNFCLQHRLARDIYCKTDQSLVCKQCATVEHQGHNKSYTQQAR